MRVHYDAPKPYEWRMQPFDSRGKVTERVRHGLENVLAAYVDIAKAQAPQMDNNVANYIVKQVYLAGSGARENLLESDLDLMLIAPRLDDTSAKHMKLVLAFMFFTDRPKTEAIDVYVRQRDIYPERPSVDITNQVRPLLAKYNKRLS
jgi:hypothetical protein